MNNKMEQRDITNKEFEYLVKLKKFIIGKCNKCEDGFLENNIHCECFKIFTYLKELYISGFPKEYINLTDIDITVNFPEEMKIFIKNMENFIEQKQGIIFYSNEQGTGKTTFMTKIMKEALFKGFKPYYFLFSEYIDETFDNNKTEIYYHIKQADIIFIDEFDKIMIKEDSILKTKMQSIIRSLIQNEKTIIIGTNFGKERLQKYLEMNNYFSRYFAFVRLERNQKEKNEDNFLWMKRGTEKKIKWSPSKILPEAEKFYQIYFEENK